MSMSVLDRELYDINLAATRVAHGPVDPEVVA
jgi:hypothetical protein